MKTKLESCHLECFSYESTAYPEPKYFKPFIEISFLDDKTKVNFLYKFYQCLMVGNMPLNIENL